MKNDWFLKNSKKLQEDFFSFLRFRSVSADPSEKKETLACASWLCDYLKKMGLSSELLSTSTYPVVYAEDLHAGEKAPTLLIYGHYDVQPVDPLEEWLSDPFLPEIREGEIYGRGASDNKGQIFYVLVALQALLAENKHLPIRIKLCFEGEEESGSLGLFQEIPKLKEKLSADYLLVPDFDIPASNSPAITLGFRGMHSVEVDLIGSKSDLHSGQHGGLAFNPLRAMVELLSKLWDEEGRVAVFGFYDDVQKLSDKEKAQYDLSFDQRLYTKTFGVKAFGGEKGFSSLEANWMRPTVEINGINGGYTGPGFKSVIPARASAKLSCRLVPNQDPKKVMKQLMAFLQKNAPQGIDLRFTTRDEGGSAIRTSPKAKFAQVVAKAYEEVFHRPCQKILSGASVPIIADLVEVLKSEVVMMGMALPTDAIHAPNEHFSWDRMEKGFLILRQLFELLAKTQGTSD